MSAKNYELKCVCEQYAIGHIGFLPFYCVLKESLHFWEWRDDSNIQSFYLVFTVWIPPEWKKRDKDK